MVCKRQNKYLTESCLFYETILTTLWLRDAILGYKASCSRLVEGLYFNNRVNVPSASSTWSFSLLSSASLWGIILDILSETTELHHTPNVNALSKVSTHSLFLH